MNRQRYFALVHFVYCFLYCHSSVTEKSKLHGKKKQQKKNQWLYRYLNTIFRTVVVVARRPATEPLLIDQRLVVRFLFSTRPTITL
jgi:hypothetical protein